MKFAMSYSFGKDSALALWRMQAAGHECVALITTVNAQAGRSWFHGVDDALMNAVAHSLGIPLIKSVSNGDNYHTQFERRLLDARALGADACVFGDIDIDAHLAWNTARCTATGLDCVVPLWQEDRESVVYELLDAGFKAIIKCVRLECLDTSYLGRTLDRALLRRIKAAGADVCGENGEYHTFVCDGPGFQYPVRVNRRRVPESGAYGVIDLSVEA